MRVSSVRWGVIWIGIGLFFLAINLELMDSLVFPRLFALWPVLLIAIGVEIMFRHTKLYFLAFLSPIIIAAAFIAAATASGDWGWQADQFWHRWVWRVDEKKIDTVEIPSDSTVRCLNLDLECGPSDLTIMPSSDRMFRATTEYYKRSPWTEYTLADSTEHILYENREKTRLAFFGINAAAAKSKIEIADYLPIQAEIQAQDDRLNLDFSELRISRLNLDIRSNRAFIRLGALSDSVAVVIDGKTDELNIALPKGTALAISGNSPNLDRLLMNSGLSSGAEAYFSNDYSNSSKRIDITLDAGIKSISINRDE
jgi:hypothetical protein